MPAAQRGAISEARRTGLGWVQLPDLDLLHRDSWVRQPSSPPPAEVSWAAYLRLLDGPWQRRIARCRPYLGEDNAYLAEDNAYLEDTRILKIRRNRARPTLSTYP